MRSILIPLYFVLTLMVWVNPCFSQQKETVGWIEKVRLYPADLIVHGKIDTGADYSSLSGSNIEGFEKAGKQWVRFDVTNRYGKKVKFEHQVVRIAMVKKHFGKPEKRFVIRLGICLGHHYMEADVNLVDRSNFENQMLIGRSYSAGNLIVDPALTFTAEPNCKKL